MEGECNGAQGIKAALRIETSGWASRLIPYLVRQGRLRLRVDATRGGRLLAQREVFTPRPRRSLLPEVKLFESKSDAEVMQSLQHGFRLAEFTARLTGSSRLS